MKQPLRHQLHVILLIFFTITFSSFGQDNFAAINWDAGINNNELSKPESWGTFQIYSENGNPTFLTEKKIIALIPKIEERRDFFYPVYWQYDEQTTIAIFSGNWIQSKDFEPLPSPYFCIKEIH